MDDYSSLSHTQWECKYHVVIIPKCRKQVLYGQIKKGLGRVLVDLANRKECQIEKGSFQADHIHIVISIPPKYSVSHVIGFLKGKSAIYVARNFNGKKKNFSGEHFWARGYFVSTIGKDEQMIKEYVRRQQEEDRRVDQLKFY